MKNYKQEIEVFYKKLQKGDKFSLSRYGDGEWSAILGNPLNCGINYQKNIVEWTTTGDDERFLLSQKYLQESIKFLDDDYYVGICPCYTEMLKYSGQNEKNITYANIFVNNNYFFFREKYIELFKTKKIHLVANKDSKISDLPFSIEKFYPVEYNAWIYNLDLIDQILNENPKDKLFLFCAGPLSDILCYKLWESNKENVYLDVGSTLDIWLDTGNTRAYYLGYREFEDLICPCPNFK